MFIATELEPKISSSGAKSITLLWSSKRKLRTCKSYKHYAPNNAPNVSTQEVSISRIEVRVYKHDGQLHRSWPAELLRQEGPLIVLDARFPEDVVHDLLGTIASGTHSLEFYWLDRWYNVFRFAKADGQIRNYYCNINVPPSLANGILSYVDLDLDILVEPDFSYRIVDLEDFESNAIHYSTEVQNNARQAVDELISLIETRQFPFTDD